MADLVNTPGSVARSTVVVAGAGQLGSRHLQGLATSDVPLRIHVHDPDAASLERSKQRWQEAGGTSTQHEVSFSQSLSAVPKEIDLAIVATTASVRPNVVAEIVRQASVRYWILEKVLAQSQGGLDALLGSVASGSSAWVNTARRTMPWHQEIKSELGLQTPLTLTAPGGPWGLACNAIHFLDLVAWWTGERLDHARTEGLESAWHESKRPGNWEVMGTLDATFSGGSRAVLTASPAVEDDALLVTDGARTWRIAESEGLARRSDGRELPGRVRFQSEMTARVAESILRTGTCALPSLAESADMHRVLIGSLLKHWRQAGHHDASHLPIT